MLCSSTMTAPVSSSDSTSARPFSGPRMNTASSMASAVNASVGPDGHAARRGRGEAGARVDDVVVAAPVLDEAALVVARGREGVVLDLEHGEVVVRVAAARVAHADVEGRRPSGFLPCDEEVAAGLDEERAEPLVRAARARRRRPRSPWRCRRGSCACRGRSSITVRASWSILILRKSMSLRAASTAAAGRDLLLQVLVELPQAVHRLEGDVEDALASARSSRRSSRSRRASRGSR